MFVSLCPSRLRRLTYGLVLFVAFLAVLDFVFRAKTQAQASNSELVEHGKCPHYQHESTFRYEDDPVLEARIERELLQIQAKLEGQDDRVRPVKKIWQTSKDGSPLNDEESKKWKTLNPDWEYKILSDVDSSSLVEHEFASMESLRLAWTSYSRPILRADMLRYLLLWYHGGFYADTDAYPKKAIASCYNLGQLFEPRQHHNISLVLGVEIDEPYATNAAMRKWKWTRRYQLGQWTLYAPHRFSPVLRKIIVRAVARSLQYYEHSQHWYWPWRWHSNYDILELTGPGAVTDATLDVLSATAASEDKLRDTPSMSQECEPDRFLDSNRSRVTWAPFHQLKQPLWLDASEALGNATAQQHGGLIILPINAWGNGQRHSKAGHYGVKEACVNHKFAGSWKAGRLKTFAAHFFPE